MKNWLAAFIFFTFTGLFLSSCSSTRKSALSSPKRSHPESSIDIRKQAVTNKKLNDFVKEWEGTPYKYGGSSKSGTDCSGFVGVLYAEVYQLRLPRTTQEIEESTRQVAKGDLTEGDLIFFDINGKKSSHVGVFLFEDKFVHASTSKGVIVSSLENPYYQRSFSKGGRL